MKHRSISLTFRLVVPLLHPRADQPIVFLLAVRLGVQILIVTRACAFKARPEDASVRF